jgi:hypothetical protein
MPLRLVFIRHLQSTTNVSSKTDSDFYSVNIVLIDLGVKQAEETGKFIHRQFKLHGFFFAK